MSYNKIIALLLILTIASTSSLGQSEQPEHESDKRVTTALTVAGVALMVVAVITGSYRVIKRAQKPIKHAGKDRGVHETAQKLAGEKQKAKVAPSIQVNQANVAKHNNELPQKTTPPARQTEQQTIVIEKGNNLPIAKNTLSMRQLEQQVAIIERGESLQRIARTGKKMNADELRSIYDGRVATLEVEKTKKMHSIHEQYPDDLYSPQELAEAIRIRDKEITELKHEYVMMRNEGFDDYWGKEQSIADVHASFNEKYPKQLAIQKLESEHQSSLERLHAVYNLAQNSTDGFPTVKYAPQFANKISAIISPTSIGDELSSLMKLGNLQEAIWKLEERGFISEAIAMKKLLEDELINGKIISKNIIRQGATKPLLIEFDSGLRGVFKGDYGQYDVWKARYNWPQREIAGYKFDQLVDLKVFPITVPRQLADGSGSMQLFVEHKASSFGKQHDSYLEFIGITPDKPDVAGKVKNRTFFELTMDKDFDAYAFNNINPLAGRTIKIDAEQAFYNIGSYNIGSNTAGDSLLENSEKFYTAHDFIERLDAITTQQLDEIFQPLFDPKEATRIAKDLYKNIRSYVDSAKKMPQ